MNEQIVSESDRPMDFGYIHPTGKRPKLVALVGLGPSRQDYINVLLSGQDIPKYDEIWVINAGCRLFPYDVVFHMDDLRLCHTTSPASIKYIREAIEQKKSVITSIAYPEWEGVTQMPLSHISKVCNLPWFTSTIAYCIPYAYIIGVQEIHLFGVDHHDPANPGREEGKDCISYWLGHFSARGLKFQITSNSVLLDSRRDRSRGYLYPSNLYGYLIPPKM